MVNIRNVVLAILLLIALALCGTVVIKIFDLIFGLEYESIWIIGFRVGFLAWILLIGGNVIYKIRKR
ncbi:hypothetical protein I5677_08405 [Mobilitalea sibirica]|uniref:Uncharacterized protein n=1 Tax=Mobilitalea sibirica TaxID=1462919 RepID=A0A8J7HDL4_9FIRM|nr:hypothetical protein [Mobilitalea sibirica]MBH1940909.1 hypothetical protein [Mobilitalea sibirica]